MNPIIPITFEGTTWRIPLQLVITDNPMAANISYYQPMILKMIESYVVVKNIVYSTVLYPELYLFIMINILLLYGTIFNTSKYYNYLNMIKNIGWLSIQILLITLLLLFNNKIIFFYSFNTTLISTPFTTFFKIFILILSIISIFISFSYLKEEKINTFEYQILLLIVIFGALCLISSNDFLVLYLSIEILSLSLYILASYNKNSSLSTEASLKYVILGSFSSGLFLFGISLIYGFTGVINFQDLQLLFINTENIPYAIILGLTFLLISFLFKLGAAPFHMWVPDVYEGIPISVTIILTTIPKVAILSILIRLCYQSFYNLINFWQPLLSISSIISIVLGTIILIKQKKIKKFLAYSSIVHMGYMLLGISLGTSSGIQATILYLIIYMINTINIWTILISINYSQKKNKLKYISDLNYLYKVNPILAIICVISLFSMAGIPPLAGFFAKFYIFLATLANNSYLLLFLGILTSVISSFYYIRIIKIIYFEYKKQHFYYKFISYNNVLIISLTTFIIIFFIILLNYALIITDTIFMGTVQGQEINFSTLNMKYSECYNNLKCRTTYKYLLEFKHLWPDIYLPKLPR